MKLKYCTGLLLVLMTGTIRDSAQTQKIKEPHIYHNFLFEPGLALNIARNNGGSLEHSSTTSYDEYNKPFLRAANTGSYRMGLGYELSTQHRFMYSVNLFYGKYRENYNWKFRFDHFDPAYNTSRFSNADNYTASYPYVSALFMFGKMYTPFQNKVKVYVKGGLGYLRNLKLYQQKNDLFVSYLQPVNDTLYAKVYASTEINNTRKYTWYYELNAGIAYPVHKLFVNECRLSVAYTHAFGFFVKGNDYVSTTSGIYYNSAGDRMAVDNYYNKFRNLVLSLSLVF